jgi:NADH:ubiquinone oxidoreductase subunit F (NADH-binding)
MTDIIDSLDEAGLLGRGGAAFPAVIKARAARENHASLIVNVCDGELGAAKDGWVVANHLPELLDGVHLIAGRGAKRARFATHRGSAAARALKAAGLRVMEVPDRYVSSEETSLINLAHGGLARPLAKRGPFVYGGRDSRGKKIRPTVVFNAETLWRVSQLNANGVSWFRSFGTEKEPGPRLVAVGGYVRRVGVYESAAGTPLIELLQMAGGLHPSVKHVEVGGLGGVLLTADEARTVVWDTPGMKQYGGSMGPGIVSVWNPHEDPIEFATRMIEYGAGESAGQCGPCMFGLPALARDWSRFSQNPSRERRAQLNLRLDQFGGRGACHHPDGVARFVRSAMRVLAADTAPQPTRMINLNKGVEASV